MTITDRIQTMSSGRFAVLAVGLTLTIGACSTGFDNGHPERHHGGGSSGSHVVPTTTAAPELIAPATLRPATCSPSAPFIEEDQSPLRHGSARLVAFERASSPSGCAHYGDGFTFDGSGWHAPVAG